MNIKTLTPIQLWQDFKNDCCTLDMSIVGYENIDNISIISYYFTALKLECGDVRVFVKTYAKAGTTNNKTMIIVDEFDKDLDKSFLKFFVKEGYTVITFDYKGVKKGDTCYTHYPTCVEYGNLEKSADYINTANHGTQNTCLFLWAKLTRRVITFAQSLSICNPNAIVAIASDTSVNLLAQVAGTDDRLKAVIFIRNHGFSDYNANTKQALSTTYSPDMQAERNRWIIGCAMPSYIKFVDCPIIYFGASNDNVYDFSYLVDMLHLLKDPNKCYISMSIGTTSSIYNNVYSTSINLLDNIFSGQQDIVKPTISYKVDEDSLAFDIACDITYNQINYCNIHYSYSNAPFALKNWHTQNVGIGIDGKGHIHIKTYSKNDIIYAYTTVEYKDGTMLSSPPIKVDPSQLDIKLNIKNNRIIYEKKYGTKGFFIHTNDLVVSNNHIYLKTGALEISGITSNYGELISYSIGDIENKNSEAILQFDCFSDIEKTITIKLTDINFNEFFCEINISNSKNWQKFSMSVADFKDKDNKPLSSWQDIKAFSFVNAENIIFNNIIWI